jgi:hypothetical protein
VPRSESRRVVRMGVDVRGPTKKETSKPADILKRTGYKCDLVLNLKAPGARLHAVASSSFYTAKPKTDV